MTVYHLSYGHHEQIIDLPIEYHVDWIEPAFTIPAPDPLQVVRDALKNPVDGCRLGDFSGIKSVAIAINDKTRPVPHEYLLPPLVDELLAAGIPAESIRFILAVGTHQPMVEVEFERVVPKEIFGNFRIVSHDCDDPTRLVHRGTTSRGTEVWANKLFMEADLRIVVGNIEPHHFAGFSGGYKTAAIGLAGRQTINHNHAMLMDPHARIAEFETNPLRQDIEEIGDRMDVHFAVNAILNGEKKIVQCVCGHPRAVIQAGIPISRTACQIPMAGKRYDIVIASVGGAPKDINFYQSQKALTHASMFTRDGGRIILVAECPEGSGSQSYEAFMEGVTSPKAVFEKFGREGFRVGPHKAFQVARDAARVKIILVSDIEPAKVEKLLMTPAVDLEEAFSLAVADLSPLTPSNLSIAMLPRATNTIPG